MLLPYEIEILRRCNGKSYILAMARGLGVENIMWYNMQFYLNQCSLAILLNFRGREVEHYRKRCGALFRDVRSTTIRQRRSMYLRGGVFSVPSRVFVTDILNGVVRREAVSVVMINHVEALCEGCAEAFAVHLLRETNKSALVKGFTDEVHPLSCDATLLEDAVRLLGVDTLLLYPWHHCAVGRSLAQSLHVAEAKLVPGPELARIQDILAEVLRSLLRGLGRELGLVLEYEAALMPSFCTALRARCRGGRARRLLHDIRNVQGLVCMLYSPSFELFYEHYALLLAEQLAMGERATWASLAPAHNLLDVAGRLLAEDGNTQPERACTGANKGAGGLCSLGISAAGAACRAGEETPVSGGAKMDALRRVLEKDSCKKVGVLSALREVSVYVCEAMRETHGSCTFASLSHREFRLADENDFDVLVLVDPCVASLRKMEVDAGRAQRRVDAILLCFEDSLEKQRCTAEAVGEAAGFERLARRADTLSPDAQHVRATAVPRSGRRIAVDSREMMSALPFAIYRSGCDIDVSTLSVGDYVLDDFTCVERKSICDLVSSFSSGRVHAQLRRMAQKYRNCVLLLDFRKNERPCLSDHADRYSENQGRSILPMLVALLLQFPGLKVIWANSDALSVRLFRRLQERAPEDTAGSRGPDMTICSDQCLEGILTSIGCTDAASYRRAASAFRSLRDLANADRERLRSALGSEDGDRVHAFFNRGWLETR